MGSRRIWQSGLPNLVWRVKPTLLSPPPNPLLTLSIEFTEHESALSWMTGQLSIWRMDGREKSLFSNVGLNEEETEFDELVVVPCHVYQWHTGRISQLGIRLATSAWMSCQGQSALQMGKEGHKTRWLDELTNWKWWRAGICSLSGWRESLLMVLFLQRTHQAPRPGSKWFSFHQLNTTVHFPPQRSSNQHNRLFFIKTEAP